MLGLKNAHSLAARLAANSFRVCMDVVSAATLRCGPGNSPNALRPFGNPPRLKLPNQESPDALDDRYIGPMEVDVKSQVIVKKVAARRNRLCGAFQRGLA